LKITYNAGRYVALDLPEFGKGGPNWIWDAVKREWYTLDPRVALPLRSYCDGLAAKELQRTFLSHDPWTGALRHPPHLTPRIFQKYAALFALSRNRSYLALDPGLGKGVIAVLIQNALGGPMLYVCPPYLVLTAAEEFKKWGGKTLAIWTSLDLAPPFTTPTVWIVPDSQIHSGELRRLVGEWKRLRPDATLVVDEAHRYVHLEARRTRALFQGLVPAFRRIVFMSGTPCPSRPMELWPVLSECAPETIDFMTESDYGRRYCGGHYSEQKRAWDFSRSSNVQELADKLHGTFMLRLRKDDVLTELPPKTEELVFIGDTLPPVLADLDAKILRHYSPEDLVGRQLATRAGLTEDEDLALSTYRRELETLKASASLKFIHGVLANGDENVLVFGYHKEAMALLVKGLAKYNPLVITGQTPMDVRHARVKAFQNDPAHRVFLANYIAGGTGYTLTKATRIIRVAFDWVPGINDQAGDRAHRIGQTDNVLDQFLVYRDSVDCKVLQVIQRKRQTTRIL